MIRDMTLTDAMIVCSNMRPEDTDCVRAVSGREPGEWFAVDRWNANGPAWCLDQGGVPWAIGGVSFPSHWSALFWMVARPGMLPHSWRTLLRATRKAIGVIAAPADPQYRHRIEAHVLHGWSEAAQFAQRLGLKHEHTKVAAGFGGESVHVYVKTGPVKEKIK